MTSLAFILGVLPLVTTKGAGAGAQNAIGTGVMGGMLSATFLAILFVPVFFIVVRTVFPLKREEEAPPPEAGTERPTETA
jgi:multidrug efflux pump subunit AcrB